MSNLANACRNARQDLDDAYEAYHIAREVFDNACDACDAYNGAYDDDTCDAYNTCDVYKIACVACEVYDAARVAYNTTCAAYSANDILV